MDLLHVIHRDDVSVQSTARLEARDSSATLRSAKVALASEQQREKVLSHAKTCLATRLA